MKKIAAYIRTHTFFKLILAFISTLTASLGILGVFSYEAYRSSLLEDAIASSRTSVSFIMERLDGEIKTLHYAALSVLSNDTLKNFDSYSKEPMSDAMFRLKKMMKEISYLENSSLPLESLWLYNSAEDLFITRYGSFSREEFLGKRMSITLSSGSPLEENLSLAGPFRYICTADMSSYYDADSILTFFRSTTDYQNRTSGQMILNVKRSTFTDILNKAGLREELAVLLLDENGGLICASQSAGELSEWTGEALMQLVQTDGDSLSLTLSGRPYTGWVTRSAESGLQYLALIDQQTLLQNVGTIRLVTLGLAALCILASAVLAFCFTTRMFAPIRKIVRYIQAEQGIAGGYQDIQLIESFMDYMKSRNQQLQQSIDSYTALMEEAALTELLYSREQPMMELYRKANLLPAFPYDYFTVAILPLDDPAEPEPAEPEPAAEPAVLAKAAAELAQKEPFAQKLTLRKIQQSERLILIFNSKTDDSETLHDFLEALKQSSCTLYAYGKTYPALTGIYDSFHQALNLLMVKPQTPESGKAAYEEALNASYITSFYPQELELKLIRQIKSKDFEDGPYALLLDLFEKNSEGSAALLRLESLSVQLMMTVNRIIAEMQLDGAAIFGRDVNQYRALERLPAGEEKKAYILDAFRRLSEHIRSSRSSKSAEIYQRMLDYIDEHYAEDLSLNELSYQLNLSPSYLSSIFKEYHHGTFLEYLNRYRIAKAKPLLLQTEDPVMAIAQQVGYANVNTFIRIFKKEEGLTPGQYRSRQP